ncbi:MAG: hypothetical protein AAGH74_01640 [Pseudomonadota bacterium]
MKAIATFLLATLISTMASAVPITFVYTGTLSTQTTLNGVDVGNQPFVVTATADNANVASPESGFLILMHDTATISINNAAALTILTPTETFSNFRTDGVGLGSSDLGDIFGYFRLADYDFSTDVAQIVASNARFPNAPLTVSTSGGDLAFSLAGNAPGTFQATIGATAVPLPGPILLLLSGLGVIAALTRHRPSTRPR